MLTTGMKQPRKDLAERNPGETPTRLGGHRTLSSVSQPVHVYFQPF